jgi:ssDNA-binding Zn-finger/Zn-ribbon topoisomerase 1
MLRTAGKLGARSAADAEIVDALIEGALDALRCPACGHVGLRLGTAGGEWERLEEDPESWGEGRRCQDCGGAIAAERLEVLPETRVCTPCARRSETAVDEAEDYCPKCGGTTTLVPRRGSGLAGYEVRCNSCRSYV